jgi:hypothetical protein
MRASASKGKERALSPAMDPAAPFGIGFLPRGHDSFGSAFEEAVRVSSMGVPPREIRVRHNQCDGSYTWTVKY